MRCCKLMQMRLGLISENTNQYYSQKLLALASPFHILFLLSWSGVVPMTAMQPLSKSAKTPSKSQYTFRQGEEDEALRRLESPPRANDGLSDIPGTGSTFFKYSHTRQTPNRFYCSSCSTVLKVPPAPPAHQVPEVPLLRKASFYTLGRRILYGCWYYSFAARRGRIPRRETESDARNR